MPGMIFHVMVYARAGGSPILAALNDAAGITGCVRWRETHDREVFKQFSDYLLRNKCQDIYKAMENHLMVDEAMHGPGSPLYHYMVDVKGKLNKIEALYTLEENHARLAELVVETSLDGIVKEKNEGLFHIIEQSQKDLDLERISYLFSDFFKRDKEKFRQELSFLKEIDFKSIASVDGIAKAWLATYKSAMRNLSQIESPQVFKPWYDYLAQCFTNLGRMERLRQLEEESKLELRKNYELLTNLDFHGRK